MILLEEKLYYYFKELKIKEMENLFTECEIALDKKEIYN